MSKDADVLMLRHENAVLRRQVGLVRYQPAGRLLTKQAAMWPVRDDLGADSLTNKEGIWA